MPKDGEGKHAIWKQPFELEHPSQTEQTEITLEAHEGSPLDSKHIGSTNPIELNELKIGDEAKELEIRIFDENKEDIGYVKLSMQVIGEQ